VSIVVFSPVVDGDGVINVGILTQGTLLKPRLTRLPIFSLTAVSPVDLQIKISTLENFRNSRNKSNCTASFEPPKKICNKVPDYVLQLKERVECMDQAAAAYTLAPDHDGANLNTIINPSNYSSCAY
jgi:hypothetical protein